MAATPVTLRFHVPADCVAPVVSVFWLSEGGGEIKYQDIPRGASASQETFPGHRWALRPAGGGALLLEVAATTDASQDHTCPAAPPQPAPEVPVAVTFSLPDGHPSASASLLWRAPGGEQPYGAVARGQAVRQETFSGHRWALRDPGAGTLLGEYTATAETDQAYAVPMGT